MRVCCTRAQTVPPSQAKLLSVRSKLTYMSVALQSHACERVATRISRSRYDLRLSSTASLINCKRIYRVIWPLQSCPQRRQTLALEPSAYHICNEQPIRDGASHRYSKSHTSGAHRRGAVVVANSGDRSAPVMHSFANLRLTSEDSL